MRYVVCVVKDNLTAYFGKPLTFFSIEEAIDSYKESLNDPDCPIEVIDRLSFYAIGSFFVDQDNFPEIQFVSFTEPIKLCSGKEVISPNEEDSISGS